MASTSFSMVLGPRMVFAAIKENRQSTFKLSAGPLMAFDPYTSGFNRNATGRARAWLPAKGIPVVDLKTGHMTDEWHRFFDYVANQRLAGINGPSMTEVQANVVETKTQAAQAQVVSAAVEQLAVSNAEALKATVQVAQSGALPGAKEIPEVVLRTSYKRVEL